MNLWIDIRRPELVELCKRVDLLVLNDEEARQLTGELNLVRAAKALHALGPRTVIIKKGEHGALLLQGEDVFSLPGLPLSSVADPTGAGDTFAGALMGFIARANDLSAPSLRKAVVYGSVLASFCVEGVSTSRIASVTPSEVHARFEHFKRLTSF
jgi:sugar/nucleoside kinase (ribokinase family)